MQLNNITMTEFFQRFDSTLIHLHYSGHEKKHFHVFPSHHEDSGHLQYLKRLEQRDGKPTKMGAILSILSPWNVCLLLIDQLSINENIFPLI